MLKENEEFTVIMFEGQEFIRYNDISYVDNEEELGYMAEGLPTDAQIDFQDELDSLTDDFLANVYELLDSKKLLKRKESIVNLNEISYHNMEINMSIYDIIQSKLQLEDFY